MDMKLLWLFIILNIVNVVLQTVKSIATIKCGKTVASLINAVAYGLYTVVVVYTVCDLDLWVKVAVVALANFVGVYVVKLIEEKARKDKIWLVKMTVPTEHAERAKYFLEQANIPFTYYDLNKYFVFDTFCETQAETATATKICSTCCGKPLQLKISWVYKPNLFFKYSQSITSKSVYGISIKQMFYFLQYSFFILSCSCGVFSQLPCKTSGLQC